MHQPNSQKLQEVKVTVQQALGRIAALASILPSELAGTTLGAVAERLYSDRRRRDGYFPKGLFGEPAWDLLLALFVAKEEERDLSLTEAYEAAMVGPGAGRKLLARMEAADLVTRSSPHGDRRRKCVYLTPNGVERLTDYLTRLI